MKSLQDLQRLLDTYPGQAWIYYMEKVHNLRGISLYPYKLMNKEELRIALSTTFYLFIAMDKPEEAQTDPNYYAVQRSIDQKVPLGCWFRIKND